MLFQPQAIFNAMSGIRQINGSNTLIDAGGAYFSRQHIINAQLQAQKLNPDARNFSITSQFYIDRSHAFIFGNEECLKILTRHGYLTLFDSTHDTNIHGHKLFTFMVRNEHGIWIPCAHALVQNERADILSECIKHIQMWCRGLWQMKYALTDDTATERLAVKQAFPGPNGQNSSVTHLLCTVHSSRTLMRQLGHASISKKYLTSAMMYQKTEGGCVDDINQAIDAAPNHETKQYITNYWLNDRFSWAMFARHHSQILLQVTTTNSVEAWHRQIKQYCNKKKYLISVFQYF